MILWSMLYVILMFESALVFLMCLPVPATEYRGALAHFLVKVKQMAPVRTFAWAVFIIQGVMFFDSMRTINHVQHDISPKAAQPYEGTRLLMTRISLLANQRNAYLSGCGFFLWIISARLITLMEQFHIARQKIKNACQKDGNPAACQLEKNSDNINNESLPAKLNVE